MLAMLPGMVTLGRFGQLAKANWPMPVKGAHAEVGDAVGNGDGGEGANRGEGAVGNCSDGQSSDGGGDGDVAAGAGIAGDGGGAVVIGVGEILGRGCGHKDGRQQQTGQEGKMMAELCAKDWRIREGFHSEHLLGMNVLTS